MRPTNFEKEQALIRTTWTNELGTMCFSVAVTLYSTNQMMTH